MDKTIQQIPIKDLKIHQKNKRYFDDIRGPGYDMFKKSIKEEGILTPLNVAPDMTILSGHQRYKAACDLKFDTVPAIIEDSVVTEDDKLRKLIASNFGRIKNNPMKQSRAIVEYENLCEVKRGNPNFFVSSNGKKQREIAAELGISVDTLKRLKRLQKLSPEVQEKVENEEMTYTTALKVFGSLQFEEQKRVLSKFLGKNLTGITPPELTQMIVEENFKVDSENGKILNNNKKIRSVCTHLMKEISSSTALLVELKRKCKDTMTERNDEYVKTTIDSLKQQVKLLEDTFIKDLTD